MVICLEQGADLHMVQLMPLPLTVSCFSKIQFGFASHSFLSNRRFSYSQRAAFSWIGQYNFCGSMSVVASKRSVLECCACLAGQMLQCMVCCEQSALSSLEDMKQAVNSGQTVSDRAPRERSPQSQKKQFLLDRHVYFSCCVPFGCRVYVIENG